METVTTCNSHYYVFGLLTLYPLILVDGIARIILLANIAQMISSKGHVLFLFKSGTCNILYFYLNGNIFLLRIAFCKAIKDARQRSKAMPFWPSNGKQQSEIILCPNFSCFKILLALTISVNTCIARHDYYESFF